MSKRVPLHSHFVEYVYKNKMSLYAGLYVNC